MLLRLLLALSLAVTGAGLAAPAGGASVSDAVSTSTAGDVAATDVRTVADDGTVPATDPEVSVSSAPLVVASTSDAAAATAAALEDGTGTTSTPSPSASTAPTTAPDADAATRTTPDEAAAATVDPARESVVADSLTTDGRVLTPAVATEDVQTIGVTWPQDEDGAALVPQARTLVDGEWSAWSDLDVADSAPDPGTTDAASQVRGGTDSFWIGEAEAVQLSFAATESAAPADLDLTLIGSDLTGPATTESAAQVQSGAATGDAVFRTALATAPATVVAAASAPAMYSRAQWGAAAPVCNPDVAGTLVGAVVHHTAGSNGYGSVAAAMQQIRNDQAYHINGRGWCDIGYNFIVDKWGNIYEGRINSSIAPVIGVHAGGFNTGTVGVAMLGTYDAAPSAATQDAVGRVIGWRLGQYGVDPQGSMSYYTGNGENSRYKNTTVNLPRIFGHRDVSFTACPGNGGHAALDNIRAIARDNVVSVMPRATAQALVKALYADLLGRGPDPTGLNTWTTRLQQGTSQTELVYLLTRSDEYINLRVAKAYREVLGREPEAQGAANWLVQIRSNLATVDDVQRRFYDSTEYYNRSGGTPEGYVQRLFQTALGRAATTDEQAAWTARMSAPDWGRARVVDGIWLSLEAGSVRAAAYYRVFLKREPDGPGLLNWANVLVSQGEGAVRVGMAGSQEYLQRALGRYPTA